LPVGEANVGKWCAWHQISAHAYSVAPAGSVGIGALRVSKGPQRQIWSRRWGSLAACGPGAVSSWSEPGHAGDCALVAAATVAELACDSRRLAARRLTRNASGGLVETSGMDPTLADEVLLEASKARAPRRLLAVMSRPTPSRPTRPTCQARPVLEPRGHQPDRERGVGSDHR
jgi:hypothetical protein